MSIYNKNYLFIRVPRTAGCSMEIRLGGKGHINLHYYKQQLSKVEYGEAFKFAFVRNPYSRALSAFFYTHKPGELEKTQREFIDYLKEGKTDVSVKDLINGFNRMALLPQWYFICNETGEIELDFVGKFENLKKDWLKVCKKINLENKQLLRARVSDYRNHSWQDYYLPESKRLVKKMYKKDFELLNYDKKFK